MPETVLAAHHDPSRRLCGAFLQDAGEVHRLRAVVQFPLLESCAGHGGPSRRRPCRAPRPRTRHWGRAPEPPFAMSAAWPRATGLRLEEAAQEDLAAQPA